MVKLFCGFYFFSKINRIIVIFSKVYSMYSRKNNYLFYEFNCDRCIGFVFQNLKVQWQIVNILIYKLNKMWEVLWEYRKGYDFGSFQELGKGCRDNDI